jgi:hypothetical protein
VKTDENTPDTLEEYIQQMADYMRRARVCVISMMLEDDEHTVISSFGMQPSLVPLALRHFADHAENEALEEQKRELVNRIPSDRKAGCPCCNATVVLARKLTEVDANAAAVCQCGAFLIPRVRDGVLELRLITDEETAALSDDMRNAMLNAREVGLAMKRQQRQREQ